MREPRVALLESALGLFDQAIGNLRRCADNCDYKELSRLGLSIDRDEAHVRCMNVRHAARGVASEARRIAEIVDYAWPAPPPRTEDSDGNETSP